jgi:hypothetical protein
MIFGDGTHSKGDPRHCTLDFYTKVQVWGRVVKISLQSSIHTKCHLGKKKRDSDVSSTFLKKKTLYDKKPIYDIKKRDKKRKEKYMTKKEEEEIRRILLF